MQATLATAGILFNDLAHGAALLRFQTLSGELVAERASDGGVAMYLPTFATGPIEAAGIPAGELAAVLAAVLGAGEGAARAHRVNYVPARKRILLHVDDAQGRAAVEALRPDVSAMLKAHDGSRISSVTVTTRGAGAYDCFSRHFSPWIGINEDPVTGSAHSYIAPYWRDLLGGKTELLARQCSERGGDLRISLLDDGRIRIVGDVVTVLDGHLIV